MKIAYRLIGSKQRWVRCLQCDKKYRVVSDVKIDDGETVQCKCSSCGGSFAIAENFSE